MAYIKGNSSPRANLDVLDKLIATRHELAQVIHFHFPLSVICKEQCNM